MGSREARALERIVIAQLALDDVDAVKARIGAHWTALVDASRVADLDTVHMQLATLHTLADAGRFRFLAQHDATSLLHFSHQLRTLRANLVRLGDRKKRASMVLSMGGYVGSPLVSLLGYPWGFLGLGIGVVFLLLTLFGSSAPFRLEEALKVLDGLVSRVQASLEGRF